MEKAWQLQSMGSQRFRHNIATKHACTPVVWILSFKSESKGFIPGQKTKNPQAVHQKKKTKKKQQTKLKVIKSFTSYGDTVRNKLICSNMDGPSNGHAK